MKIATINILIDRDPMSKLPKTIWPWELPLFESQWPGGLVVVDSEGTTERDELPDAYEEFNRCRACFGTEAETKINHCDLVYGRHQAGVKALEKAIKASVVKPKRKRPTKKKVAKKPDPLAK